MTCNDGMELSMAFEMTLTLALMKNPHVWMCKCACVCFRCVRVCTRALLDIYGDLSFYKELYVDIIFNDLISRLKLDVSLGMSLGR